MNDEISQIRNLGPETQAAFERAGIKSASELRQLGADLGYARLLAAGIRPHFIGYYSLVMGLQGRPWNDCQGAEKDALRVKFDKIKSDTALRTNKTSLDIEYHLNKIGTGQSR